MSPVAPPPVTSGSCVKADRLACALAIANGSESDDGRCVGVAAERADELVAAGRGRERHPERDAAVGAGRCRSGPSAADRDRHRLAGERGAAGGSVSAAVTVWLSPNVPLAGRGDERQRRWGRCRSGEPVVRAAVVVERDEAEAVGRLDDELEVGRGEASRPFQSRESSSVPQAAGSGATHCWRSSGAHVPLPVV